jgi:hypothetical protein
LILSGKVQIHIGRLIRSGCSHKRIFNHESTKGQKHEKEKNNKVAGAAAAIAASQAEESEKKPGK